MPDLLTLAETAERLRVSRATLRKLINTDPDFRTVKIGARRLVSIDDLHAFIRAKAAR